MDTNAGVCSGQTQFAQPFAVGISYLLCIRCGTPWWQDHCLASRHQLMLESTPLFFSDQMTRGDKADMPGLGTARLVPLLMFANDLLVLSTSATGLQNQLDALQDFCTQRKLMALSRNLSFQVEGGKEKRSLDPPVQLAWTPDTLDNGCFTFGSDVFQIAESSISMMMSASQYPLEAAI
ncbi:hypothetical protein WJX77_005827 [Trebouxia sp. C0004]